MEGEMVLTLFDLHIHLSLLSLHTFPACQINFNFPLPSLAGGGWWWWLASLAHLSLHVLIHFSWVPALTQSTSPHRARLHRTEDSEPDQWSEYSVTETGRHSVSAVSAV